MFAFFREAVLAYKTTGAIAPSGPALARAMTRSLAVLESPKRVLEVGPGTGAFTRRILASLVAGDEFHIVEINPVFADCLEKQLLQTFRRNHPEIALNLHRSSIQQVQLPGTFDVIICGLPFNLFPVHEVSRIFRKLISLLDEGGTLSYFEYVGMKAIKMPWLGPRGRRRLRRRIALSRALDRRFDGRHDLILGNFPPAHAIRLKA